jgi:glyoxylate utilization-related uncharacterized protein
MKFIVSSSYLLKQLQVLGNVINSNFAHFGQLPIWIRQQRINGFGERFRDYNVCQQLSIPPVKEVLPYRQNYYGDP